MTTTTEVLERELDELASLRSEIMFLTEAADLMESAEDPGAAGLWVRIEALAHQEVALAYQATEHQAALTPWNRAVDYERWSDEDDLAVNHRRVEVA